MDETKEAPRHVDDISESEQAALRDLARKSILMAVDVTSRHSNICKGCVARIYFEAMLEAFGTKVDTVTVEDLEEMAAAAAVKH